MNTVITIAAIIVLAIVIIIAISGSRNLRNFRDNMDKTFDNAWKDAGKYIEKIKSQTQTIILKYNSPEILEEIKSYGINVCRCCEYDDSVWLNYNDYITDMVHGVGYHSEEDGYKSQEERIQYFISEVTNPYYCNNTKEFIEKILEQQKLHKNETRKVKKQ